MMACVVAYSHGLRTAAVISGVGARGYYEKLGFRLRIPYGYMTMGLSFARIAWYIIKVFLYIMPTLCITFRTARNRRRP